MATATKKKASSTAAQWDKVRDEVKPELAALQQMQSHQELFAWAKEHSLNTKSLFPLLKREWRKHGIDYEAIREAGREAAVADMTAAADSAPELALWIYTDAEHHVFAVSSDDGVRAWYGEFHEQDFIYKFDGDQIKADQSAAEKAIFLAGKAREEIEADVVRLTLRTSNHEITGDLLKRASLSARVVVTVDIADGDNPATEWVMQPGFASWRDVNLENLFTADDDEEQ